MVSQSTINTQTINTPTTSKTGETGSLTTEDTDTIKEALSLLVKHRYVLFTINNNLLFIKICIEFVNYLFIEEVDHLEEED
jgi:hypothetical protein